MVSCFCFCLLWLSTDKAPATAQGIIAQVRVLGGSIGIAASSAILSVRASRVTGGALNTELMLHSDLTKLSPEQQEGVRMIYTLALKDDMIVCSALLAAGVFVSAFAYRKGRMSPEELGRKRREQEEGRIQAGGAEGAAAGGQGVVVKAEV